jgi:shikimate kinase
MTAMRALYLVGFMGAGKSSVGRAVAAGLGWSFVDLDAVLEERFGATIAEVFSERGETVFRVAETAALERMSTWSEVVAATGGGAFCTPVNRALMHAGGGVSVFLDVPWEVVSARLSGANPDRPKFGTREEARRLYEARRPLYQQATETVELTGDETPEAVAGMVVARHREVACAT